MKFAINYNLNSALPTGVFRWIMNRTPIKDDNYVYWSKRGAEFHQPLCMF
jgi:hypothetical protein